MDSLPVSGREHPLGVFMPIEHQLLPLIKAVQRSADGGGIFTGLLTSVDTSLIFISSDVATPARLIIFSGTFCTFCNQEEFHQN